MLVEKIDENLKEYINGLEPKLKMIPAQDLTGDIIEKTLQQYGVEDVNAFRHFQTKFEPTNCKTVRNIELAEKLWKAVKLGKKVYTLVDPDADGYTSSALLINYFKKIFPKNEINYLISPTKKHGIQANQAALKDKDIDFLVMPDSSSNDYDFLSKQNFDYLVIDHHNINGTIPADMPIISGQFGDTNKELTGVGMVFLVATYLDAKHHKNIAQDFLDLVMIGEIGDVADVSNPEIRIIMNQGFNNINNPLLKTFFKDDDEHMSAKHLSFSIIPQINAITRIGDLENRAILMNALIDKKHEYVVEKRKKNRKTNKMDKIQVKQNIQEYAIDMMAKIKRKQDSMVNKAIKNLDFVSDNNDNYVLAILPEEFNAGITGLIANKLMSSSHKPTFLIKTKLNLDGKIIKYQGSIRFPISCKFLYNSLNQSDIIRVQGHDLAAGLFINTSDLNAVQELLNGLLKQMPAIELTTTELFINEIPTAGDCKLVDKNQHLFGGSIKEPSIGVYGLKVDKSAFKIGDKYIKLEKNGIELTYFFPSDKLKAQLTDGFNQYVYINFYGSLGMNYWLGQNKPQIIMDELVVSDKGINQDLSSSLEDLGF